VKEVVGNLTENWPYLGNGESYGQGLIAIDH